MSVCAWVFMRVLAHASNYACICTCTGVFAAHARDNVATSIIIHRNFFDEYSPD